MPNTKPLAFLASWQADYNARTGKQIPGKVVRVFGRKGCIGGLAIWVEVLTEGGQTLYFSPYLNPSPGDGEHIDGEGCTCESCAFDRDPEAWLDSMTGATNWAGVRWGPGEEFIPAY